MNDRNPPIHDATISLAAFRPRHKQTRHVANRNDSWSRADPGSARPDRATWETSHPHVGVRSAAGRPRKCLPLPGPARPDSGPHLQVYGGASRSIVPRLCFWNAPMSRHRRSGAAVWSWCCADSKLLRGRRQRSSECGVVCMVLIGDGSKPASSQCKKNGSKFDGKLVISANTNRFFSNEERCPKYLRCLLKVNISVLNTKNTIEPGIVASPTTSTYCRNGTVQIPHS